MGSIAESQRQPELSGMDIVTFQFDVTGTVGAWTITCSCGGETSAESKLDLDLNPDEQLGLAIQRIEDNRCSEDDLSLVGVEFWQRLTSGEAGEFFQKKKKLKGPDTQFHLQLNLPPLLHRQPWETLYDDGFGFLVCDSRHSILRGHPNLKEATNFEDRNTEPLRILLIIPDRSNLPSVDNEIGNLNHAAEQLEEKPTVEMLTGRVTSDLLHGKLLNREWDIVHYIGHGDVDENGGVTIRFHKDDGSEMMMEAEVFAAHFSKAKVRLVVLNCCLGDSASPNRSLSGLGPFLMRKKIPAVVAMRYEIPDPAASKFSLFFYQCLLGRENMGRVDLAVDSARDALYRNQQSLGVRSFITPVLYLAPGWSQLFDLKSRTPGIQQKQVPAALPTPLEIPPELRQALKERRCFVVAGPGILANGAVRRYAPPPGPRELAKLLADDPADRYPQQADLRLCEWSGEWLSDLLLQWVCAHRSRGQRRGELIAAVQAAYNNFSPPESVRSIAEWKVPALFYTFFDGLMERACEASRSSPSWQVFPGIPNKIKWPKDGGTASLRLFAQLRGTVSHDDSLVLTDVDHEALWVRVPNIDRKLTAEIKRANRCVLFLGTDPRDPLIRRLSQQILDGGENRTQGPTYFASPAHTAVDDVYWNKYRVSWIGGPLDAVILKLSESAA